MVEVKVSAIKDKEFGISDVGKGLWFQDWGFIVDGLRFDVQSRAFRIQELEFRVHGLGFRV